VESPIVSESPSPSPTPSREIRIIFTEGAELARCNKGDKQRFSACAASTASGQVALYENGQEITPPAGCEVTVTLPDGSTKTGAPPLDFEFYIDNEKQLEDLTVSAEANTACHVTGTASKTVGVFGFKIPEF
jgi:hypothetical protein